jgi:WD40 repeat protein
VRFWRASDAALKATFGEHTAAVRSVAFSPDGTLLASGSDDTTAKLWRTPDGTVARTLDGHVDVVNAVAFSPDSSLVATAAGSAPPDTQETTIKIWNVGTGALVTTLSGHASGSTGVAFSADGQTIISSGRDNTLRFWRVSDGTLLRAVTNGAPHGPLAITADRTIVAVPGNGGRINFFSTVDGSLLRTAQATTTSSLSFSGDGTLLAAGEDGFGNNVQIFRVADGTLVRTLAGDPNGFVQGVAFTPDGTTLASSSGFTRTIQLWDPATGALRTTYDQETGWSSFVQLPVAYSPDGTQLGYGRGDATVVLARP